MVSSPLRSKACCHSRSVSLPSRSHPLIPQFNELLCRLKASEATSSSLPSISNRLSGLEDLYDCVEDLLQLPHTQKAFAQECNKNWVDEALDGYMKLLDVCSTTKDVFSQTKQDVQELLSIMRRRRDANDFGGYVASRKKARKMIEKSLKDMMTIKSKNALLAVDKDRETVAIISMLNEVEAVTLALFESLLSYIAGTKLQSRMRGWSFVSKLMHQKSVACQDEETVASDFEKVDVALHSLNGHKTSKSDEIIHIDNVQNRLGKMESSIQDLEEGLECLFRRLIKTRVFFLNILNH